MAAGRANDCNYYKCFSKMSFAIIINLPALPVGQAGKAETLADAHLAATIINPPVHTAGMAGDAEGWRIPPDPQTVSPFKHLAAVDHSHLGPPLLPEAKGDPWGVVYGGTFCANGSVDG